MFRRKAKVRSTKTKITIVVISIVSWISTVITCLIFLACLSFFVLTNPGMSHVVEVKSKHFTKLEGVTIMLHGSGDNADSFAKKVVQPMYSDKLPNRIFIVPDAPYKLTRAKDSGRCWHLLEDIVLNIMFGYVSHRMRTVDKMLVDFIDQTKKKYNCDNVEIVAFSDGAIMAMRMLCLLDYIKTAYISSGVFLTDQDHSKIISNNCRIFVTHGMIDPVVWPFIHWINKRRLAKAGAQHVTYKTGFYAHTFIGLQDGTEWIMNKD